MNRVGYPARSIYSVVEEADLSWQLPLSQGPRAHPAIITEGPAPGLSRPSGSLGYANSGQVPRTVSCGDHHCHLVAEAGMGRGLLLGEGSGACRTQPPACSPAPQLTHLWRLEGGKSPAGLLTHTLPGGPLEPDCTWSGDP